MMAKKRGAVDTSLQGGVARPTAEPNASSVPYTPQFSMPTRLGEAANRGEDASRGNELRTGKG